METERKAIGNGKNQSKIVAFTHVMVHLQLR
ncbi:hypothetical protein HMPREF9470_05690, partial [[Clostridium] citroniae WAL-19142]